MASAVLEYPRFIGRCFINSFRGGPRFLLWMAALTILSLIGLNAYCKQLVHGLRVTGMSDQVSWGLYIANFTYLVGIAAAAVKWISAAFDAE